MGRKSKIKVVFDQEIVTKEVANRLVAEHEINEQSETINSTKDKKESLNNVENALTENSGKPKMKKKRKQPHEKVEQEVETKKQKQDPETPSETACENGETEENVNMEKMEVKREDSIRAMKRKKHAALMQEKKLKAELALQQKCLNYISQWKHNRSEWKFEKLKQVWLQQNMFNSDKIPAEIWDTVVDYFCGCKGKARETIIQDAVKVIDAENESEEDGGIKMKRARDIVQNMHE